MVSDLVVWLLLVGLVFVLPIYFLSFVALSGFVSLILFGCYLFVVFVGFWFGIWLFGFGCDHFCFCDFCWLVIYFTSLGGLVLRGLLVCVSFGCCIVV